MAFIPTRHPVEVANPREKKLNRFNVVESKPGKWRQVYVASWWIGRTEEQTGDSVLRTIDELTVHFKPKDAPPPGGKIRLPDGSTWEVSGHPEDYRHGFNGFDPGLLEVHARKVEG